MIDGQIQKYGQIAEGKRLNDFIYHGFQYLKDGEVEKFVREFKQQPHDKVQVMHTFRELILGAYLSQNNLLMCHNYEIDSKTPDWCVLYDSSHPRCVIELVNFHPDVKTSTDIINQIKNKRIWCNFVQPNTERLYNAIWEKASKYKSLASKHELAYVVSVFGEFAAMIDQEEIDECLFDKDVGLFKLYPEVSGLLYFEESSGIYFFTYKPNPLAKVNMNISSGRFQ